MMNPENNLHRAYQYQAQYDDLAGSRFTPTAMGAKRDEMNRFHYGGAAQNYALLAIAGFLAQMHVCDHGVRGWCPHCFALLQERGSLG